MITSADMTPVASSTRYLLSSLSIELTGPLPPIFETPYVDPPTLNAERDKVRADWFLWRAGAKVLGIAKHPGAAQWGIRSTETHKQHPLLLAARIQATLPSLFPKYEAWSLRPFRFAAQKGELVAEIVKQIPECPAILRQFSIRRQIELDVKALSFDGATEQYALTIAHRARYEINAKLPELAAAGLDARGLVACRLEANGKRSALGVVKEFDGKVAKLVGAQEVSIPIDDVRLEGSRQNFSVLLGKLFGKNYALFEKERLKREGKLLDGPASKDLLVNFEVFFKKKGPLTIGPGLTATISTPISLKNVGAYQSLKPFNPIQFCFDASKTKLHQFPDQGLHHFGPYSADTFPKKSPTVLALIPKRIQGSAEKFLSLLQKGFPPKGAGYPGPYEKGFARHFGLANPKFDTVIVADPTDADPSKTYLDALNQYLAKQGPLPDISIVFLEDRFSEAPDKISPYVQCKAHLMAHGIPVQEVREETINASGYSLPYSMINIAVASYAKMGGTPWTVPADGTIADELVIGMGQSEVAASRFGDRKRYVGLTTVFKGDGNYLLSNCSTECSFEDYPATLKKALSDLLAELKVRNGWRDGDTVRLVFHSFKPLKNVEVGAIVAEAVRSLGTGIHFQHAFLNISREHPFAVLDTQEKGKGKPGREPKGVLVPARGLCAQVTQQSKVLCVNGPSQLKLEFSGLPKPLLIELHKQSSFTDQWYLAEQVFKFTGLSWRSTQPAPLPVTILYSQLIADLIPRLRHSPSWSPAQLNTKLRHSRWFL